MPGVWRRPSLCVPRSPAQPCSGAAPRAPKRLNLPVVSLLVVAQRPRPSSIQAAPGITEDQIISAGEIRGNFGLLPLPEPTTENSGGEAAENPILSAVRSGDLASQVNLPDMMVAGIDGEEIARDNTEALLADDLLAETPQDSDDSKDQSKGGNNANNSDAPDSVEELAQKSPDDTAGNPPADTPAGNPSDGGSDDFATPMLSENADPGAVRDDYEQLEATPDPVPDPSPDDAGQDDELAGLGIPGFVPSNRACYPRRRPGRYSRPTSA